MTKSQDPDPTKDSKWSTHAERTFRKELDAYFARSPGSNLAKLDNFPKYVPRQSLTRFLTRYEIFKKVLRVQGSVVECGVLHGGGLMTFAQLSAILEPVNWQRRVIGFDTFSGFHDLSTKDEGTEASEHLREGGLDVDSFEDLEAVIGLFDQNRSLGHIPKCTLVRGDVRNTIPEFLEENPYLVVSLLYLDLDVYEPTKVAIENLLPRMPRGAVIVFDELNAPNWSGETAAVMESVGVRNLSIERFEFDSLISYAVLH